MEPEKAQFNGLDQKLYEKMTASIKEREDKLCDQEDYVDTKKLLENKERTIEPAYETLEAKENETEPEKDRLKRTKTVSYLDTGTH